ncbi:MAG: hypothetical protein WD638_11170, partial [Nitriliruptoraceae bacterium]
MAWWEMLEVLQPCDPDITILLLRHALNRRPEEVDLELFFELVAQLVTDLQGWTPPPQPSGPTVGLTAEKLRLSAVETGQPDDATAPPGNRDDVRRPLSAQARITAPAGVAGEQAGAVGSTGGLGLDRPAIHTGAGAVLDAANLRG